MYTRITLVFAMCYLFSTIACAQDCVANNHYPYLNDTAPVYSDTPLTTDVVPTDTYFYLDGLLPDETYQFEITNAPEGSLDYLTVRDDDLHYNLGAGHLPYTYIATHGDRVTLHVFTDDACGDDNWPSRKMIITCLTCDQEPPKVGVETTEPMATLDVSGDIRVADSDRPGMAGMIKFDESSSDFIGFNGEKWVSLTKPNGSGWGVAPSAFAQENNKFRHISGTNEFLGSNTVDIDGNYAVVGLPWYIHSTWKKGRAFVYKKSGADWELYQTIYIPNDIGGTVNFGAAVTIYGNYMAISAPNANIDGNTKCGAVITYRLEEGQWTRDQVLSPNGSNLYFGTSLDMDRSQLLVGSENYPSGSIQNRGRIHIYRRLQGSALWGISSIFIDPTGIAEDRFGYAVAIKDNLALVSNARNEVFVYVKENLTWSLSNTLTIANSVSFGHSLSIGGGLVAIADHKEAINGNAEQGSVNLYIIDQSTNMPIFNRSIKDPNGGANFRFGSDVQLLEDKLLVGANQSVVNGVNTGAAYYFEYRDLNWTLMNTLISSNTNSNSKFGSSVGMTDSSMIILAPRSDSNPANYIFTEVLFYHKN